eukprot:COSAG02_NODE_61803_length_267_cov_1.154762_1_plen_41_part_10
MNRNEQKPYKLWQYSRQLVDIGPHDTLITESNPGISWDSEF